MTEQYWTEFWKKRGVDSKNKTPQEQVLRVERKKPIDEDVWENTLLSIESIIQPLSTDRLLDLCSGNGLITSFFAPKVCSVYAVDISEDLVNAIPHSGNVITEVSDVRQLKFQPDRFNKVILYAGVQYLSNKEVIVLIKSIHEWLEDGGVLYIGDIPDNDRLWNFYNNTERENAYFGAIESGEDVIGNWFTASFFEKLASFAGFSKVDILEQQPMMIYSHYRFDVLLRK